MSGAGARGKFYSNQPMTPLGYPGVCEPEPRQLAPRIYPNTTLNLRTEHPHSQNNHFGTPYGEDTSARTMSTATERVVSPALPWESSVGPAAELPPADGEAGTPTKKVRRTVTLVDQSQTALSGKKLVIVIVSLAAIIFLASFQQVSVSTTLPGIAKDFGTSTAISWVGTAFLVAK
jgi:hypothetical protein